MYWYCSAGTLLVLQQPQLAMQTTAPAIRPHPDTVRHIAHPTAASPTLSFASPVAPTATYSAPALAPPHLPQPPPKTLTEQQCCACRRSRIGEQTLLMSALPVCDLAHSACRA